MSEAVHFERRDFLKLVGIGVAGAASGCAAPPAERLIPYLVAPADILPGVAYWYASTCRECPAGCGVQVRTREGRAIKVEGHRDHPLSRGGLCARGQASLQGLYDPDRIKGPMAKVNGAWKSITWDEGLQQLTTRLRDATRQKRGVALLTDHATGSFEALARAWATAAGGAHLVYEPFAYESLREANQRTFGRAEVPVFDFGRARMVVSFGADFLETFGHPVAQARGFAAMRSRPESGYVVAVEPRLSLTGANADEWVAVRPGGEMALALGMARVIVTEGLGPGGGAEARELLEPWLPETVQQQTGVHATRVVTLARQFAKQRPSLAVAGGIASQSEQSVALLAAVNLLNWVAGNVGDTVRFDRVANLDAVQPFGEVQRLIDRMGRGEIDLLLVHGANPVYATPAWAGFAPAMDKVIGRVSLSSVMDETTERCDLVLPAPHWLECWGDAEPARGVWSLQQPVMRRLAMFDTRPAGDTLIVAAKTAGFGDFPDGWEAWLKDRWRAQHARFGAGREFHRFWDDAVRDGGVWEEVPAAPVGWSGAPAFAAPRLAGNGDLTLLVVPSAHLYDGRGANKPWLQELPDPTTKAAWDSWVEIHPETAAKLGIQDGDTVRVETEAGSVETYAYLYHGIRRDCVAIPLGQGHTAYGRYAKGRGVNPLALLPAAQDAASGAPAYLGARARVTRVRGVGIRPDLPVAQRDKHQYERGVAQLIPVSMLLGGLGGGPPTGGPHQGAGGAHGPAHGAPQPEGASPGEAALIPHGSGGQGPRGVDENVLGEIHPMQHRPGKFTEPRQLRPGEQIPPHAITAYEPEEKVRAPRQIPVTGGSYSNPNHRHRWAMAIDLNSCTGCSACVVACYAENNVPVVGPEMMKRGREMAWIRIERYEERLGYTEAMGNGPTDVRFLPMLCQHCTDAPCEIVCPVYATYHNPEGLNAQVYNRCVGTRYCSNNCPYKVRAFNWYDYAAPEKATFAFPEPLNWQLNPDVTVRSKGVMEKCTFCIQRILEGKGAARDENRPLQDGEIQTACAQSCPSRAIVFGDLLDPESRVAKLSAGERRYWALNELNTKPGVTYLMKMGREGEAT